jgi:hypothetical protein
MTAKEIMKLCNIVGKDTSLPIRRDTSKKLMPVIKHGNCALKTLKRKDTK